MVRNEQRRIDLQWTYDTFWDTLTIKVGDDIEMMEI